MRCIVKCIQYSYSFKQSFNGLSLAYRITLLVVCVYDTKICFKLFCFLAIYLWKLCTVNIILLNLFHYEIDLIESRTFCFLPVSIVNISENVMICLLDLLWHISTSLALHQLLAVGPLAQPVFAVPPYWHVLAQRALMYAKCTKTTFWIVVLSLIDLFMRRSKIYCWFLDKKLINKSVEQKSLGRYDRVKVMSLFVISWFTA